MMQASAKRSHFTNTADVVVIGAGFAGLLALQRLVEIGLSVQAFEAAAGVGGTWYYNRYPGARCDSEVPLYQYFFSDELAAEWRWSERYPAQAEILAYLNFVADRCDLRRHIMFETEVISLQYEEDCGRWTATTNRGDIISAQYCVTAVGCLSAPIVPNISGIGSFKKEIYFTSSWPHEGVDFKDKQVAVIGTGSSGIQVIPFVAAQAAQLYVFQRSPNFSLPAKNRPLTDAEKSEYAENFAHYRSLALSTNHGHRPHSEGPRQANVGESDEEIRAALQTLLDSGGTGILLNFQTALIDERVNRLAADVVRGYIRQVVKDPAVAEVLVPTDHPIGTKRLCLDTSYYETYNRKNVTLVDLRRTPISCIDSDSVVTGQDSYAVDMIIFATGFDAITGPLLRLGIRGKRGLALRHRWLDGPKSYLGLMMAGFPNLFTITGHLSPSVFTNVPVAIEQHVDWIVNCIRSLRDRGISSIDARPEDEEAWGEHVRAVAELTLFTRAQSWYMGANVEGKPRTILPYLGGMIAYRAKCAEAACDGYRKFDLW